MGARKLNVYFPPLPLSWPQVNFLQFVLPVLQLYFFFTLRGLVFLVFVVLPLRPVWSIFFYFDTRYVNKLLQTENFYFSFFPFFKAFPPKGDHFAHAFSFFAGSVKR